MTETQQKQSSDRELFALAQTGNVRAFEVLVERHIGMVYAIAYARTRNQETAEDLTQEAFLRAYLALETLKEADRFCVWLKRITCNLITDWQRREKSSGLLAMVPISQTDMIESVPDMSEEDPRERMHQRQHDEAVRKAILHLPSEQREIVMLHYAEDLNHREIACRLEIHPSTVGRHLKRGLDALKDALAPMAQEAGASLKTLRVSRKLTVRTALIIGSAAALSSQEKSALAFAAGKVAEKSAESLSSPAFVKAVAGWLTAAKLLATSKAAVVVAALVIALGGGVVYMQRSASRSSEAIVNGMPLEVFSYFKKIHESMRVLPEINSWFMAKTIFLNVESPEKIVRGYASGFRSKYPADNGQEILYGQGNTTDTMYLLSHGDLLKQVNIRIVEKEKSEIGRYDCYVTLFDALKPGDVLDFYKYLRQPPLVSDVAGIYHTDAELTTTTGNHAQFAIMLPEEYAFTSYTEEPFRREQFENRQVYIWRKDTDGRPWKVTVTFRKQDK